MEKHTHRKVAVFGVSVVGSLLVMGSMAFACVQSRGKITVTGTSGGTSMAVGNGHHPNAKPQQDYLYCKPGKFLQAGAISAANGTFTVNLGPPPTACQYLEKDNKTPWIPNDTTPNVFVDGTYQVNFCQGQNGEPAFQGSSPIIDTSSQANPHGSCYFNDGVSDWGTLMGEMTVTGGAGTSSALSIPFGGFSTPAGTYAGVSVRDMTPCNCGPPPINMAPVSII